MEKQCQFHKIKAIEDDDVKEEDRRESVNTASDQLLAAESEYILAWRKQHSRASEINNERLKDINGLALSGGGIRSATFALGVMQALANRDKLARFDYLSTVSGGGYIGSAISWLLSNNANSKRSDGGKPFSVDQDAFPFGTDSPDPHVQQTDSMDQRAMLQFIRQHGHYLSPGAGINIFALLGVVLRGTLLNLIVWLPLLVLVMLGGFWLPEQFEFFNRFNHEPWLETLLARVPDNDYYVWSSAFVGYEFLLRLVAAIVAGMLASIVLYSIFTWFKRRQSFINGIFWYKLRRNSEKISSVLLPLTLIFLIIGLLPVATAYFNAIGPLALVAGIVMQLVNFWKKLTAVNIKPLGVVVPLGAALFLYGFFVVGFQLGYEVQTFEENKLLIIVGLILIPVITGYFSNINYISFNRFYRDRLMESFMPDIDTALVNGTGMAKEADEAHLCCFNNKDKPTSPYHLINTNVVLADSPNPTYKKRGGDNFILSPYYCGSNATGWCPTHEYMQGKMTLATALAISGAAINPNAGVGGEGVTRNKILSLVLSLLNLRLGYWAHNPSKATVFNKIANHFNPSGFYTLGSIFSLMGFAENKPFVELSDGGHFENMAMYELIRRQARVILVSDAGEDPDFGFSDFQNTLRRIETDFGARIDFSHDNLGPDQILPLTPVGTHYPQGARFSERGYMKAVIHYADGSEGTLIYLKSTLIKTASFKVKGYKAQNPTFPNQSTTDQFFDEVQFEAYRELGYEIASGMMNDVDLDFSSLLESGST
jgi:patatin-like phospholipase